MAEAMTVSALTLAIRSTLQDRFDAVCVEGEVTGLTRYSTGTIYFSLKDEGAVLSAVLFKSAQRVAAEGLKNGMKLRVYGSIDVSLKNGRYSLLVRTFEELASTGDLMKQFNELKERLKGEGLFDPARKRPLPFLPRHIGVITSESGAVIHDILSVLNRRFPNVHVLLIPAPVQGADAPPRLLKALNFVNSHYANELDVLIIGRGGGSMEDLWCFNDETLVRAVAASTLPIISAVGHETDFTLCDFAADVRAATPSAAAEMIVGRKEDLEKRLVTSRQTLQRTLDNRLERERDKLARLTKMRCLQAPEQLLSESRQRVDTALLRLMRVNEVSCGRVRNTLRELDQRRIHALAISAEPLKQQLAALQQRLSRAFEKSTQPGRQKLQGVEGRLHALNPLAVLQRGYSLTRLEDGTVVKSTTAVTKGTRLRTQLADGEVTSTAD